MTKISSCMLFVDEANLKAVNYAESLRNELTKLGISEFNNFLKAELIIVLGGDGTMLRAKEMAWIYKIPLLGLNFGHK